MSILETEIKMAEDELELAIGQYVAVSEQMREMIDESLKLPLELKRRRLARRSQEMEAKLNELKSRLPTRYPSFSAGLPAISKTAPDTKQSRTALLVGIDHYRHYPDLGVCANDAIAVGNALRLGDYQSVDLITDHDDGEIENNTLVKGLNEAAARETDLLLFYFSGHGNTVAGESYLVMPKSDKNNLAKTGVPLSEIKRIFQKSRARSKVIVIDSCHAGADFVIKGEEPPSMPLEYIEHLYLDAKGWAVMASCERSQKSYVWIENKRSVFTHFLLEALSGQADYQKLGFVSILNAYSYILPRVREWTKLKNFRMQTPTLSTETAGDIVLTTCNRQG